MTKYKFIPIIFISAFIIALGSCKGDKKAKIETKEAEVIPENIVELREDQVKLAKIETGSIETR
jgi:hypothetical protein